jgi:hypothetical protein
MSHPRCRACQHKNHGTVSLGNLPQRPRVNLTHPRPLPFCTYPSAKAGTQGPPARRSPLAFARAGSGSPLSRGRRHEMDLSKRKTSRRRDVVAIYGSAAQNAPPPKGLGIGEMAGDWGESGKGVDDALTRAIIDAIVKVHEGPWAWFRRSNLSAGSRCRTEEAEHLRRYRGRSERGLRGTNSRLISLGPARRRHCHR